MTSEPIVAAAPVGPVAAALVLAGGSGTRLGAGRNKVLLPLGGEPIITRAVEALAEAPGVGPVVLVRRPADAPEIDVVLGSAVGRDRLEFAAGGATRQASELAGLRVLAGRIATGEIDVVLVHDGARPLVPAELVARVLAAARVHGGAVPGLPRDDLAVVGPDGRLVAAAPRLVAVQTPQGFRATDLLVACEAAAAGGFIATDTASCVAAFCDLTVVVVPGSERNLKVTVGHDLALAERLDAARDPGQGPDVRMGPSPSGPLRTDRNPEIPGGPG